MKTLPFEAAAARRRRAFSFLAFALLLAAAPARAQLGSMENDPAHAIGTRLTARNTIQGSVAHPSGHRFERRVRVRITGQTGQTLQTFTDDQGNFVFRRLAGGTYFLTVEAGEEFQVASETVDIFARGSSPITVPVYVQLRYKKGVAEKLGTVNAALAGVPKPALESYEKAVEAAQAGDSKKAVEALRKAVEQHPDFALAYNMMGVQYLQLGRLGDAAEALRQALRLTPEEFNPLLNYGVVLFHQGQYKESEAHLRKALGKRETSAAAHFFLGRVLIKGRRYAEAEKELRRAVELDDRDLKEAYRYLGGLYRELGDRPRAVESLEKYLKLEPKARDAEAIRQIIAELRAQATAKP